MPFIKYRRYKLKFSETIDEVKKELSSDEQILASAFKLEKFYKKHKFKLFAVVGLAIAYFGGTAIMEAIAQGKRESANSALLTLQKDENNSKALKELKTNNPALFELFTYQEALKSADTTKLKSLSSSKNSTIADIASYHLSVIENREADSRLYDDMAKVYNASLKIKAGKISEAKDELELISEDSPAYNISIMLKHYTIKGK